MYHDVECQAYIHLLHKETIEDIVELDNYNVINVSSVIDHFEFQQ